MASITREARDGLMRAWLEILREKHPGLTWVPATQESGDDTQPAASQTLGRVSATPGTRESALAQAA
jgi:hypothetical protein